ncbi:response regulator transcription factor [Oleiagrimonas sp. C23AA]|uniref:winged helix-turn-helix domain-containing protein n=1 Tax=Oleiagrimonas sp. C23AA TaxID=2719047 RepID=UPI001421A2AA|nr:response regulator transcription factor [Oleiagrimonas sp. C23AA]NII11107.1 response regulator transcription factor [Oleiagrimonas sp. C23AA]
MRILLIEDDAETRRYIQRGLDELGYAVTCAANGAEGVMLASELEHDVIVLDRLLPRLDGLSVLKALRSAQINTPVLMLTALAEVEARVEGIEAGADDYLSKPFAFTELAARIGALARRPPLRDPTPTRLRLADLEMDLLRREVHRGGELIDLQPREFKLLEYFLRNAGRVVTRTMLLEQVWDYHFDPKTSVVETHISRLRGKIERNFQSQLLHTVRGAGYCLKEPDE